MVKIFKVTLISFIGAIILPISIFAQEEDEIRGIYSTVQGEFVFHHNTYLQYVDNQNQTMANQGGHSSGFQELNFKFSLGWYDVPNKYAVGLGIGLSNNPTFAANAIPLFIEGRYFIFDYENSPFIYASLGRAIPLFKDSKIYITNPNSFFGYSVNGMQSGFLTQIGIGKKFKFFKRLSLLANLTYDIKRYSHSSEGYSYFKSDDFSKFDGIAFTFGLFIK